MQRDSPERDGGVLQINNTKKMTYKMVMMDNKGQELRGIYGEKEDIDLVREEAKAFLRRDSTIASVKITIYEEMDEIRIRQKKTTTNK